MSKRKKILSKKTKEKILDMYFVKHMKQKDIAVKVKVRPQYVSEIVRKDSRYQEEKDYRKQQNDNKYNDRTYQWLLLQQRLHARDGSAKFNISDKVSLGDWNSSVYSQLSISEKLEISKLVKASAHLPK